MRKNVSIFLCHLINIQWRYECHFARITSNINMNKLSQLTVSSSGLKSPYHSFERISRSYLSDSAVFLILSLLPDISRKGRRWSASLHAQGLFRLCSRCRPKIEFQVSFRFPIHLECGLNPDGITDCRREVTGYVNVISKQGATSPRWTREG